MFKNRIRRERASHRALLAALMLVPFPAARAQREPFTEYTRVATSQEVTVKVDAARPAPFTLPDTLFGTFTENIWDAVYGGVWAQILHNPSFEPDHLSVQNILDAARYGRLVTDPSFGSGYVRVEPLAEEAERGRFIRSSAHGLPLPWEPRGSLCATPGCVTSRAKATRPTLNARCS